MQYFNQLIVCPKCIMSLGVINALTKDEPTTKLILSSKCDHEKILNNSLNQFDNTELKCDNHIKNRAIYFCPDCKKQICQNCKEKHHNLKLNHFIYTLERKNKKKCQIHQERVNLFCNSCQVLLCKECAIEHKKHIISENLEDYYMLNFSNEKFEKILMLKEIQLKQLDFLLEQLVNLKFLISKEILHFQELREFRQFENIPITPRVERLFSLKENKLQLNTIKKSIYSHKRPVFKIINISSNKFATGSEDNTIKIWDFLDYNCEGTIKQSGKLGDFISILNNSQIASVENDINLIIWSIKDYKIYKKILLNQNIIELKEIKLKKILCSRMTDNTIRLVNLNTFNLENILIAHKMPISFFDIFLNNRQIYSLSNDSYKENVIIWKENFYGPKKVIEGDFVNKMIELDNQCLFGYSKDNLIRMIDLKGENDVKVIKEEVPKITDIFKIPNSINNKTVLIGTLHVNGTIFIWNINILSIHSLFLISTGLINLAVPVTSTLLALVSDDILTILDLTKHKIHFSFQKEMKGLKCLMLLSNGLLAAGLGDNSIKIYE